MTSGEAEPGAPHPFSVDRAGSGERCRLTVRGDVDIDVAPRLTAAVGDALRSGCRQVAVDLSSVTFMDSTGLTALLRAREDVVASGGSLRLTEVSPAVVRLLDIAALTDDLLGGRGGGEAP